MEFEHYSVLLEETIKNLAIYDEDEMDEIAEHMAELGFSI